MEVDAAYADHADGENQDDADGQDDNKEECKEADQDQGHANTSRPAPTLRVGFTQLNTYSLKQGLV